MLPFAKALAPVRTQDLPWFEYFVRVTKTPIVVRRCYVRGVCSEAMIEALMNAPSNGPLMTDAANAIVEHAWSAFRRFVLIDLVCAALSLALLCRATVSVRAGGTAGLRIRGTLGLLVAKTAVEEVFEASASVRRCKCLEEYVFNLRNVLDWARNAVEFAGLGALSSWDGRPGQRGLVAVWCAVKWLQVLYTLRGFELFGPRILPIFSALKDTAAFFVVMTFCLLAVTHGFYVLGTQQGPGNLLYAAFLPAYRLGVTGDYDMDELAGVDPPSVGEDGPAPSENQMYTYIQIWFYVTSFLVTILMMNILVGILGANYERYEEQSPALFVRERARMINIISARPWTNFVWKRWEDGWLYFVTKEAPNTEDERSTRRAMQVSTEEALKPLKKQIEEMREQMRKQNENFEAKFEKLLKALNAER